MGMGRTLGWGLLGLRLGIWLWLGFRLGSLLGVAPVLVHPLVGLRLFRVLYLPIVFAGRMRATLPEV